MEKAMKRDKIEVNDRQLACARINSKEGQVRNIIFLALTYVRTVVLLFRIT